MAGARPGRYCPVLLLGDLGRVAYADKGHLQIAFVLLTIATDTLFTCIQSRPDHILVDLRELEI